MTIPRDFRSVTPLSTVYLVNPLPSEIFEFTYFIHFFLSVEPTADNNQPPCSCRLERRPSCARTVAALATRCRIKSALIINIGSPVPCRKYPFTVLTTLCERAAQTPTVGVTTLVFYSIPQGVLLSTLLG